MESIKKWCEDNAALSPEALTMMQLKTAQNWNEFYPALQRAREQKYGSLLPIIVHRYVDFRGGSWPTNRGIMAQTMYELGDEKYIAAVRRWNIDTTDKWVTLWTSLFLIKHDKDSYDAAMEQLEVVLNQCDGTTYYPHAMDLLLALNNPRALKMAEHILDKDAFQRMIDWDYYENIIRKLLLAKSDYTFDFLKAKLNAYTDDEIRRSHKDNDRRMTQNDIFVLAVDELKNEHPLYFGAKTNAAKQAYIRSLDSWFKGQYALLKAGKPNELLLDGKPVNAPVMSIDTYRR